MEGQSNWWDLGKIKALSNKTSSKFYQNNPWNILNGIHNQFVVTPTDKTNKNVALFCQRFYALVLIKELGLDHKNIGTNKNYILVHKTNNHVISGQTTSLRN